MTVQRVTTTEGDAVGTRRAVKQLSENDQDLETRLAAAEASITALQAVVDFITTGTGDPSAGAGTEADQGSLFLQTDGAADSTLWVKEGAGDTDWNPCDTL